MWESLIGVGITQSILVFESGPPYPFEYVDEVKLNQRVESNRTVEVHRAKLLKKFGATNTAALFQSLGAISGEHVINAGHQFSPR